MTPDEFFFVALTPDADCAAAGLARVLRAQLGVAEAGYSEEAQPLYASLAPRNYGVGGPELEAMGLEQIHDKSGRTIWSQLQSPRKSGPHHIFTPIYEAALQRQSDVIVCVGESPVFQRFAASVKSYIEARRGLFFNWEPVLAHIRPATESPPPSPKAGRVGFDCDLSQNRTEDRPFLELAARSIMNLLQQRRSGVAVA